MTYAQTVLVVDDDATNVVLLRHALQGAGYRVITAHDGQEAIPLTESEQPDLILMDIEMPQVNGLEACKRLKANPATASVPVIFITASGASDRVIDAFAAGGADFVTKPVKVEEVLARTSAHLRLRHVERALIEKNEELGSLARQLIDSNAQLEVQARSDSLTGLMNRGAWFESAKVEFERARRHDRPFAIVMLDVDLFKRLNDSLGHAAGDACLRKLAACMAQQWRSIDLIGCYGGEEFVVFMPDASTSGAIAGAHRFRKALRELAIANPGSPLGGRVTVSIGIAVRGAHLLEQTVNQADAALYAAKRRGRNRAILFDPMTMQAASAPELGSVEPVPTGDQTDGDGGVEEELGSDLAARVGDSGGGDAEVPTNRAFAAEREDDTSLGGSIPDTSVLSTILENLPYRVFWKDRELAYRGCNAAFAQDAGLIDERGIIGKTDHELAWAHEQAARIRGVDAEVLTTGRPVAAFEELRRQADGRDAWLSMLKVPICDSEGRVRGVLGLYRDVTDRKLVEARAEEHARLAELRAGIGRALMVGDTTQSLVQGCVDVLVDQFEIDLARIWTLDEAGAVLELRASAGLSTHINGDHARVPVGKFEVGKIAERRVRMVTNDVAHDPNIHCAGWARREKLVSCAGYPLCVDGALLGVMVLFAKWPMTDTVVDALDQLADHIALGIARRQSEEALERARLDAERANEFKSQFVANMSHELRTPLNGVIGMTELLLSTKLDESQRRFATLAKSSGETLLSLISDVLDFSKIEAGKLELEYTDFDLRSSVESVASNLALRAEQKGVGLICYTHRHVPDVVCGDAGRLQQVLLNLVGNAVKFTDQGEIVMRTVVDSESDTHVVVRFTVSDTGIGVPADRMHRLFASFSQVDASTTRRFGGSGLGLAISKQIVELMDGDIGVHSDEGRGSTFWFTARFEKCGQSDSRRRIFEDLRTLRMLIVDDDATNREVYRDQLRDIGVRPALAMDGVDALRQVRDAADAGRPFDLAVLDLCIEGMDGLELARAIRGDSTCPEMVLVLASSSSPDMDESQLRELGFSALLMKPFRQSQLLSALAEALVAATDERADDAVSETSPVEASPNAAGIRLLIAEDDELNLIAAVELLSRAGYVCETVANGALAVEAVTEREFDVVLMDCQMPEMDGFEASRRIRALEREGTIRHGGGRPVPIVALTANAISGDRERCLAAGMNEYVTKPIRIESLRTVIDAIVGEARGDGDDAATKALGTPEASLGAAGAADQADAPAFDRDRLAAQWGNDSAFIQQFLGHFASRVPEDAARLHEAVAARDAEQIAGLAHKLKGAAGYVAATRLVALARQLELMGKAGELSEVGICVAQLEAELERCLREVSSGEGAITERGLIDAGEGDR